MSKSKLQILAQKRNSSKGRVKGLRNNIRGLLDDPQSKSFLTFGERSTLKEAEINLDGMLTSWDHYWEQIKEEL